MRTTEGEPVRSGYLYLTGDNGYRRAGSDTGPDETGSFRLIGSEGADTLGFNSVCYRPTRHPLALTRGDTVRVELIVELRPMFQVPLMLGPVDTTGQQRLLRDRTTAARVLGLPVLAHEDLPEGVREIRMSNDGGIGSPYRFVRLVNEHGHISGQAIMYHSTYQSPELSHSDSAEWLQYYEGPRCDSIRTVTGPPDPNGARTITSACFSRFSEAPDWAAVWTMLEDHQVWTLPDDSALPWDSTITFDGWMLQVETRDGTAYRAYSYSNPDEHHPAWSQPREAYALGQILSQHVYAKLAPEGGRARYRGHAVELENGTAMFFPCDRTGPWQLAFVRSSPVIEQLEDRGVLFIESEGSLQMPGRYSRQGWIAPDEAAGPDELVFARRLYLLPDEEPQAVVSTLRPGDCEAPVHDGGAPSH